MEETLGVEEAAERLRVHPMTIRRWIKSGSLPAVRLGERKIRIKITDLDAMSRPVAATPTKETQE